MDALGSSCSSAAAGAGSNRLITPARVAPRNRSRTRRHSLIMDALSSAVCALHCGTFMALVDGRWDRSILGYSALHF